MRKLYVDLAIGIGCIYIMIKFTKLFIALAIIGALVWFLVLDDNKRNDIKEKISSFYIK